MEIEFGGEKLILRYDRTLFWPKERTLMAADIHFGKLAHFRKNGSGIPDIGIQSILQKLLKAGIETRAERFIILGDFFHSAENAALSELLENWHIPMETWLIPGNHDRLNDGIYQSLGFQIYSGHADLAPFRLTHEPAEVHQNGQYYISGHVHPAVRVEGKARQRLRLPCFYKTEQQLIIPAIGEFTGTYTVRSLKDTDRAYAIAGKDIFEVLNF